MPTAAPRSPVPVLSADLRAARRALPWLLAAVALLCHAPPAAAHPEGFSGLKVEVEPTAVRASLTIHTRDTGNWFPPRAYPNYVADVCRALEAQSADLLDVRLDDGPPVRPSAVRAWSPEVGMLRVDLTYPSPPGVQTLAVTSPQIRRLPRGHTQLVLVEDRRAIPPGKAEGPVILQDDLDAERTGTAVDLPPIPETSAANAAKPANTAAGTQPSTRPAAANVADRDHGGGGNRTSFFQLGVAHILTGYDHLLFVAALLLACRTLREAATIITFFTVAHSITLTLAALDLVRLSGSIVEPAIAGTILFVAAENLWHRPNLRWRCAVTFFFGLIHGLGFASDLREMLPGSTFGQVVGPLLKFSAGVEAGHLSLVAAALPLLLWMKRRAPRVDRYLSPWLSGAISAVGAVWLVGRVWASAHGEG